MSEQGTKQRVAGKVKFFDSKKGFGFIRVDGSDEELFFHVSDLGQHKEIDDGQAVTFERGTGKKGPKAANVRQI